MSIRGFLSSFVPLNLTGGTREELEKLRIEVAQCRAVFQSENRSRGGLEKRLARLRDPSVKAHVQKVVAKAEMVNEPFPHIVIEQVLPETVYDDLLEAIPSPLFFEHLEVNKQDLKLPFEFAPRNPRELWGVFQEEVASQWIRVALTAKFQAVLDEVCQLYWPDLGSLNDAGIPMEILNSRIMRRCCGYEIKPHRDPRWAFLTCIMYLTRREEMVTYGTQLCRLREEREADGHAPFWLSEGDCEMVREVAGLPNTAVVFLNSTGVHRASIPSSAPPDTERYIYQFQLGPEPDSRERLLDLLSTDRAKSWRMKSPT